MRQPTNKAEFTPMEANQGGSDPKLVGEQIRARREALGYRNQGDFADALAMSRSTIIKAEQGRASEKSVRLILQWLDRAEGGPVPTPVAPPDEDSSTAPGPVRIQLHNVAGIEDVDVVFDGNTPPSVMETYIRALLSGIRSSTDTDEPGDEPGGDGT